MKFILVIVVFLSVTACFGNKSAKDDNPIIINNNTVTDAPATEVNPPNPNPSPSPNVTTTTPSSPTNSATPITPDTSTTPITTTSHSSIPTTIKPSTTSSSTPAPTTKPSSTTSAPTKVPATTTTAPHHERRFDGPSFVGGIILALGLVAIGFIAFKFYKARTELNYHTL